MTPADTSAHTPAAGALFSNAARAAQAEIGRGGGGGGGGGMHAVRYETCSAHHTLSRRGRCAYAVFFCRRVAVDFGLSLLCPVIRFSPIPSPQLPVPLTRNNTSSLPLLPPRAGGEGTIARISHHHVFTATETFDRQHPPWLQGPDAPASTLPPAHPRLLERRGRRPIFSPERVHV